MYIDIRYIQFFDNTSSFNTMAQRTQISDMGHVYMLFEILYLDTDLDSNFLDERCAASLSRTHEDNYIAEKSKDTLKYIVES